MRIRMLGVTMAILLNACGESGRDESTSRVDSMQVAENDTGARPLATMSPAEREALKESLMKQGRYDCCSKPGCTLCIANEQQCDCYLDIKRRDPICGECFEGYKAGRGKLKLVSIVELEKIRKNKGASR